MQEPITSENLAQSVPKTNDDFSKLHEIINEKDVIIRNNLEHISDLEQQLIELQTENKQLKKSLNEMKHDKNSEFEGIMNKYDKLFYQMLTERECLIQEKDVSQAHLAKLESAFRELLDKYERTKSIILGFKENEDILKQQLVQHQTALADLKKKYGELKVYAEHEISLANMEISNKEKGNIEEVAKLKSKILQSQVKISELEKYVKFDDIDSRTSIFTPLSNDHLKNN